MDTATLDYAGDVDRVAKAIAKARMRHATAEAVGDALFNSPAGQSAFEEAFERRWNGMTDVDVRQRERYRRDAVAALHALREASN